MAKDLEKVVAKTFVLKGLFMYDQNLKSGGLSSTDTLYTGDAECCQNGFSLPSWQR